MSEAPTNPRRIATGVSVLVFAVALGAALLFRLAGERPTSSPVEAKSVGQAIMAGIELGKGGQLEEAAQHLAAVVAQNPSNTDALFNYGVALGALEKWDEADQVYLRLLELAPEDWGAVAERAAIAFAKEEPERAYGLLESIPVGQGNMVERLKLDPAYQNLAGEDRMKHLRAKHGLPDLGYEAE